MKRLHAIPFTAVTADTVLPTAMEAIAAGEAVIVEPDAAGEFVARRAGAAEDRLPSGVALAMALPGQPITVVAVLIGKVTDHQAIQIGGKQYSHLPTMILTVVTDDVLLPS